MLDEIREALAEKGFLLRRCSYTAIPVPSIAVRFLIGYDGFPLQILTQIVGKKASYKTSLALEIAKWHIDRNGYCLYIDTEGGSSAHIEETDRVLPVSAVSIDEWITVVKTFYEKTVGLKSPTCVIIDSIAAVTSSQILKKFEEEGVVSANYPIEAKSLSAFFRLKSALMKDSPVSFIAINHIKETINPYGITEEYNPGGKLLQYVTNLQLKTKKLAQPIIKDGNFYSEVEIRVEFNRLGNEGRSIVVPISFKYDKEERSYSITWDWFAATTKLMLPPTNQRDQNARKLYKAISDIIKVNEKAGGPKGTLYYCNELGIDSSSAVSATELGKIIESDKQVLDKLSEALYIKKARLLTDDVGARDDRQKCNSAEQDQ